MIPSKSEHDRFYSSIARFYSQIFPLNPAQIRCVENELESIESRNLLDVGCGCGNLAFAMAEKGASVTAIDLNDALLDDAINNRNHQNITYRKADMLDIDRLFKKSRFDGVICFGNTLVHLENPTLISRFFRGVYNVLKPDGIFFLQILNYDYIFDDEISELPTIENEKIRFERKYNFTPETRKIRFITKLEVKPSGEFTENETELLGLGKNELLQLLNKTGFHHTNLYADFQKTPADGKHLQVVCISRKTS